MSKTKLSNDALLLRINDLRTTIVNEDIQKIAKNNSEIEETLENYEKGKNVWSGADVIITEQINDTHKDWLRNQPLVISFQQFDAMKRLVVTQHAFELSWLFILMQ